MATSPQATGLLREGYDLYRKERERRIASAKRLLEEIEAINQVDMDLRFWLRRIRRAIKRNASYVSNTWSFRGSVSPLYLKNLSKRLGDGFTVDSSCDLVVVSW